MREMQFSGGDTLLGNTRPHPEDVYKRQIAISNHRIKSMTDTTVTYVVKDYKNEGCWKEKTISGEEFIRRFMMHVPPKRFVRIRHYGLLSCRNKRKKITHCRNLLGCKKYISTLKNLNAVEMIKVLYHIDVCKCSSCGGNMVSPVSYTHLRKGQSFTALG